MEIQSATRIISKMPTIKVTNAFTLNLRGYVSIRFNPGLHSVDQSVADHWYVKANSEVVEVLEGGDPISPAEGQEKQVTANEWVSTVVETLPVSRMGNKKKRNK